MRATESGSDGCEDRKAAETMGMMRRRDGREGRMEGEKSVFDPTRAHFYIFTESAPNGLLNAEGPQWLRQQAGSRRAELCKQAGTLTMWVESQSVVRPGTFADRSCSACSAIETGPLLRAHG